MSTSTIADDDITPEALRLSGRTTDDPELQAFLRKAGGWPLKPFAADEFNTAFSDKTRGYQLLFRDAATVKHAVAAGKADRLPLFIGTYFFTEGCEGNRQFAGALPHGVKWTDKPDDLLARLGTPKNVITSKKTGALTAHRWAIDELLMSVNYRNGAIESLYIGII